MAARLVAENGLVIARWAEALRPVRRHLLPPLAALLVEDGLDAAGRRTITGLYGDYAEGLPDAFAPLEKEAAAREPTGGRRRRPAGTRAAPGQRGGGPGRPGALAKRPSVAAARARPDGAQLPDRPPGAGRGRRRDRSWPCLTADGDDSVRRAALLALGEFDEDRLPLA